MAYSFLHPGFSPDTRHDVPVIPRIIWQTSSPKRLSIPQIADAVTNLRSQHPDWEYNCLNDDEVETFFSSVGSDRLRNALRRLAPEYPQTRTDIYRYLQLFLKGGVYLDDKSGTTRPLDSILRSDDHFLISQGADDKKRNFIDALRSPIGHIEGGEYVNWFIASRPGHPFLAAVLEAIVARVESYSPLLHGYGKRAVLDLTGPFIYTRTIAPLRERHPHRMVTDVGAGLQYSVFGAKSEHESVFPDHYSRNFTPPVTTAGLGPIRRKKYHIEWILGWPYAELRKWNARRLGQRRQRRQLAQRAKGA